MGVVLFVAACHGSASCPAVPIHCACAGATPVCTSGQWVCPDPATCADGGASDASAGCASDAECGAGAYCRGLLNVCKTDCQLTIGTATTGSCHRSCLDQSCSCVDDSDCPGRFSSCNTTTHTCMTLQPPICHSTCPAGCTDAMDAQYGEVCVCASCP